MADFVSFDKEFMERLKHDRLLFLSEIIEIGKKYGLSGSQVKRILAQAESMKLVISDTVFIYTKDSDCGNIFQSNE